MAKRQISNLDLKVKLTNEYLRNGGVEKIWDAGLLQDLIDVIFHNGKADPNTVSTRANAFMLVLLADQMQPPFYSPDFISEYQSTLQKSTSFDQENIDTPEQFDKVYEEYKSKTDFLFRGQREAKWRLYSTLQRRWILDSLKEKGLGYQTLLEKMVGDGRINFEKQINEILKEQHVDSANDVAILGFLQHHGCPTPLLDWTYKFQNALYFALDGLEDKDRKREIDDYFSVYLIEEKDFAKGGMRHLIYEAIDGTQEYALKTLIKQVAKDEETRVKMEEHFKGRKAIDIKRIKGSGMIAYMTQVKHLMNFPATYFADGSVDDDIVFSLNNSKNILNQAGVFTWNADPTKPFEMIVSEQNQQAAENATQGQSILSGCFNINKKLAEHIRKRLEADGITKEIIYPAPELNTWNVYEKNIT